MCLSGTFPLALQVKDLEAQLAQRPQREEMQALQAALAEAEAEKVCLGKRLLQMENRNAALEERGTAFDKSRLLKQVSGCCSWENMARNARTAKAQGHLRNQSLAK